MKLSLCKFHLHGWRPSAPSAGSGLRPVPCNPVYSSWELAMIWNSCRRCLTFLVRFLKRGPPLPKAIKIMALKSPRHSISIEPKWIYLNWGNHKVKCILMGHIQISHQMRRSVCPSELPSRYAEYLSRRTNRNGPIPHMRQWCYSIKGKQR
jgi:hypothetical protein